MQVHASAFLAFVAIILAGTVSAGTLQPAAYGQVKIKGYVGGRLDACIANNVTKTDAIYLTDVFKNKDETDLWQTEFWGKWMHSAVPFWTYTGCPVLKAKIDASLKNLLSTQLPDGYIGNYRPDKRSGKGWDVWGNKYTLLGLLHDYDGTGDKAALDAARKLADYLMGVFGPGKREICQSGYYIGMPSCSVLEPIVWLYNRTQDKKYLDFAAYIVSQLNDSPDGPKLIDKALAGVDVADRTPVTADHFVSMLDKCGLKAYEMMSCYQGMLEYYEVTGDKRCLDAAIATAKNIAEKEINIVGGAASEERWYHGTGRQTQACNHTMETCVLTTWIRLCEKLLAVTGDSFYADQLEKSFYNSYLASLKGDGSVFAMYTPLAGFRSAGYDHCRMKTNCCNSNGPRGFLAFLRAYLMADGDEAVINFYETSRASVTLPLNKQTVTFETYTLYPKEGSVMIWNRTEKPLEFTLKLRVPAWSASTSVKVNGVNVKEVKTGSYLSLRRVWNPGDKVDIAFDMTCHAQALNDYVAFTRGPIVLARDMRFHDGDIGEIVRLSGLNKPIPLTSVRSGDNDIWMGFVAFLGVGSHTENEENARPQAVHFCDFASAGGTWNSASSYRVWLPVPVDPFARR